jgi:hypothetical protein
LNRPITLADLKEELKVFKKELEGGVCTCPNMITKMGVVEDLMRKHNVAVENMTKTFLEGLKNQGDRLSQLEVRVISLEQAKKVEENSGLAEVRALIGGLIDKMK